MTNAAEAMAWLPTPTATALGAASSYIEHGLRLVLVHGITSDGGCTCGDASCDKPGKHPVSPSWQKRTFDTIDAFRDAVASKAVPANFNLGLVLGEQLDGRNLIAIDVDNFERLEALEAVLGKLPFTLASRSGGGGSHRIFTLAPGQDPARLKNRVGLRLSSELKTPGVDVRWKGGQIVVCPSLHGSGKRYAWTDRAEVAQLPQAWFDVMADEAEAPRTPSPRKPRNVFAFSDRYIESVIANNAEDIASRGKGERNHVLWTKSCTVFEHCAGSRVDFSTAVPRLQAAGVASGLPAREVEETILKAERHVRSTGRTRLPTAAGAVTTRLAAAPGGTAEGNADPALTRPDEVRTEIHISANTHEVTDAMCSVLHREPGLFHRDAKLVHLVVSEEVTKGETVLVARGTPQTRDVQLSTLIDIVSKHAICMSYDARASRYVHKAPPKDRVQAVRERGEWRGLPELVGVLEAPSMRPDGSLIQTPGYDAATRFLYEPSEPFELVPDAPTQEQARAAFAELAELYCDFPYVNESHRSAAIALPVTLIARPAIEGPVPAWLFDASVRRTGKTKQVDAGSILATGRAAGRSIFPSKVTELDKVMAGHALGGTPLIFFDNVPASQQFAGAVLDAWVTAEGRTNFRLLGKTGDHQVEWRSTIAASGNGIECGQDLAPRCLAPRLESPMENPELRTGFRHDPLLPWVKENRARLVVAILTLLRSYVVAGRPDMKIPRWGSFEAWTGLVASALVWAGAADPTEARKASGAADDPKLAAERVLVAGWKGQCNEAGKDSLTTSAFVVQLYSRRESAAPQSIIDARVALREALEFLTVTQPGHAPDSKSLGAVLRGLKHRNVQGLRLTVAGESGGVARWKTEPVKP